ncbi:hypothetical protein D3C78_1771380 [compost metagenome]
MRQAAAHRGVAFEREHLGFLLQTANGGGIDNTPAIALELPHYVVFFFGFNGVAEGPLEADFLLKVDPGHLFLRRCAQPP